MNILVIGNGFDLAHGLPTKYTDFLGFVERFENLKKSSMIMSNGGLSNTAKPIYKYLDKLIFENRKLSFELDKLISLNIWIEYFFGNEKYIKENWIDFESEISKVIRSLDNDILKNEGHSIDEEMISLSNPFLAKYYEEYTLVNQSVDLLNGENSKRITFRDIRDKLYYDLNRLIRALEIYLADYVEKIECNRVSPDIEKCHLIKFLVSTIQRHTLNYMIVVFVQNTITYMEVQILKIQ